MIRASNDYLGLDESPIQASSQESTALLYVRAFAAWRRLCSVCVPHVWVSAGLWSKWLLNYHVILKTWLFFVGVLVLSARFASVHDGAQTSAKNRKAKEVVFQHSSIFFVSQQLGNLLDCPPTTSPLSVFEDAFSLSLLGIALPTFVWLSFTLSPFTPWVNCNPSFFYLTLFKAQCHQRQCYSQLPQRLNPPHQQF